MLTGWREKSHKLHIQLQTDLPMKFLNCWWNWGCFQLRGQLTITVLCFRPPSPPTWIRWDVPSRRLEEMTTWEKPFTFSVSISLRRDCRDTEWVSEWWQHWSLWKHVLCGEQVEACVLRMNDQCPDLVGPLSLSVVVEERPMKCGTNDGQTFPCFQLIGQRQQARLLYVLLGINTQQNQDLRPDKKMYIEQQVSETRDSKIVKVKHLKIWV